MKRFFLMCLLVSLCMQVEVGAQGYRNPVLPGFYPDPSVCRVGDTFYLVNSSFQFFPGVPLHRSKDLIHWEPMGHVLTRPSQLNLKDCTFWEGIYAPTIRHHEGRFYMVTTLVPHGGNFYVWTDDIEGEWSDPIFLQAEGIDPDLFFDEDNRLYYTSTIDGQICTCEIDPATGCRLSEIRPIWRGEGGRYPEAPHLYRKGGWYYLMISEGGTEYGHYVTIARSRSIWGPYESNPANPILTHRDYTGQNSPIQGLGHADLVQAEEGSWWLVALGFRPFDFCHTLGRETFLAPVEWDEQGWPVVNGNGTLQLDMQVPTLEQVVLSEPPLREEFDATTLGPRWQYLLNPHPENYSLAARRGWLRLQGTAQRIDQFGGSPTALFCRQHHHHCHFSTRLDMRGMVAGDRAGLTIYLAPNQHFRLAARAQEEGVEVQLDYLLGSLHHQAARLNLTGEELYLKGLSTPKEYTFFLSTDGHQWQELGRVESRFLAKEVAGGFTGVVLGLFAEGEGYADFDYFDYTPMEQ